MRFLSLSTAEQGCSLAVFEDMSLVYEEYWTAKLTHSKRLVRMIDHMFEKRTDLSLADIDVFVAAKGPGSFTGLRIGISVTKGLAYAMKKPALGVSRLDGIAYRFSCSTIPVCVMMDARRQEVYSAVYQFKHGRLISKTNEKVTCPEQEIEKTKGPTLFAGSGARVYKEMIVHNAASPELTHESSDYVSAVALVQSLCSKKNFLDHPGNSLSPAYIRKSDAQLQFSEK